MLFNVQAVVDGDTFTVSPGWKWNGQTGDIIRVNGYNTPEKGQPGFEEAKGKLMRLIEGKEVDLKKGIKITFGRLLCDVYVNENNLRDYFPEYQ